MRRLHRWKARIVGEVQASEVPRVVAAAMSIASSLDLTVDDAIVFTTPTSSLCVCCLVTCWPGWHL